MSASTGCCTAVSCGPTCGRWTASGRRSRASTTAPRGKCRASSQIVRNGDFIGVVAEREEQAIGPPQAIEATWTSETRCQRTARSTTCCARCRLPRTKAARSSANGDVDGALRRPPRHSRRDRLPLPGPRHRWGPPARWPTSTRTARRSTPSLRTSSTSARRWPTCSGLPRSRSTSSSAKARGATGIAVSMMSPPTLRSSPRRSDIRFACSGCGRTSSPGNQRAHR